MKYFFLYFMKKPDDPNYRMYIQGWKLQRKCWNLHTKYIEYVYIIHMVVWYIWYLLFTLFLCFHAILVKSFLTIVSKTWNFLFPFHWILTASHPEGSHTINDQKEKQHNFTRQVHGSPISTSVIYWHFQNPFFACYFVGQDDCFWCIMKWISKAKFLMEKRFTFVLE